MLNNSSDKIKKEFENLRNELLDLTLRNQLLNFKTRARTITISNQSPINIYQTLVLQNNKMYFVANKKEKKEEKSGFSIPSGITRSINFATPFPTASRTSSRLFCG